MLVNSADLLLKIMILLKVMCYLDTDEAGAAAAQQQTKGKGNQITLNWNIFFNFLQGNIFQIVEISSFLLVKVHCVKSSDSVC